MHMYVHRSTIHNSQKVGTTQMSINGWMDKETMVHPCKGRSFGHKKEWSADTCYNVDELWNRVKWKKSGTKGHILYDSIHMKSLEEVKL